MICDLVFIYPVVWVIISRDVSPDIEENMLGLYFLRTKSTQMSGYKKK